MKLNVESADWFLTPEMMGHYWAKDQISKVKKLIERYGKTNKQMEVIQFSLDLDSLDWHKWNFISNKYIKRIQYVLRRIGKESWNNLLHHDNLNSGVCKDSLSWYLEIQSYRFEFGDYFKNYRSPFMFLGMSNEDALERFIRYHDDLCEKHGMYVEA